MASFSYQKFGQQHAHTLALEWCRKNQFAFDLYNEQFDEMYQYQPSDFQYDIDGQEFIVLKIGEGCSQVVQDRALQMAAQLMPKPPMRQACICCLVVECVVCYVVHQHTNTPIIFTHQ